MVVCVCGERRMRRGSGGNLCIIAILGDGEEGMDRRDIWKDRASLGAFGLLKGKLNSKPSLTGHWY